VITSKIILEYCLKLLMVKISEAKSTFLFAFKGVCISTQISNSCFNLFAFLWRLQVVKDHSAQWSDRVTKPLRSFSISYWIYVWLFECFCTCKDHLSTFQLIYNKMYVLKTANYVRKIPKIKVFNWKKWRKMTLEYWKLSAVKWNFGCRIFLPCEYRKMLLHKSKPCGNSFVTPSLLSLTFVHSVQNSGPNFWFGIFKISQPFLSKELTWNSKF